MEQADSAVAVGSVPSSAVILYKVGSQIPKRRYVSDCLEFIRLSASLIVLEKSKKYEKFN